MIRILFSLAAAGLLLAPPLASPAAAQNRLTAKEKQEARREGRAMGLRPAEIERQIREEDRRLRQEGRYENNNFNNQNWNNNNWNNNNTYRPAPLQQSAPAQPAQPPKPKAQPNTALGEPAAASLSQIRGLTEELAQLLVDEFYAVDVILDGSRLAPVNMAALRVRVISNGHLERDFAALDTAVLSRDLDTIGTYGQRLRLTAAEIDSLQIRAAAGQLRRLVDDLAGVAEFQTITRRMTRYLERATDLTEAQKSALAERLETMTSAVRIRESLTNPAVLAAWPPEQPAWPGGGKTCVTTVFSEGLPAGKVLVLPFEYLLAGSAEQPTWIAAATPAEALHIAAPRVKLEAAALAQSTPKTALDRSRVRIAYPLALEAEPGVGEPLAYHFEGREYELAPGGGNAHARGGNGVIEFEAAPGREPTRFALDAGSYYGFTREGEAWKFGRYAQHEYRLVIDNRDSGLPFKYTVNGLETAVQPWSVAKWVLDTPMKVTYDAGGGRAPREFQQTEEGVYRLVRDAAGKSRLNNETTLRVALAAGEEWALVGEAHWGSIEKRIPERVDPASLAVVEPRDEPSAPAAEAPAVASSTPLFPERRTEPGAETVRKPTLYVLAIGVSKYQREKFNLSFAHRDAEAFRNLWLGSGARQGKGVVREGAPTPVPPLYEDVVTELLVNEEASKVNILKKLNWLKRSVTSRDVAVLMFSGHGLVDENNRFYLATHELDPEEVHASCVSKDDVRGVVEGLASRQTFLFFDACHSGQDLRGRKGAAKGVMDNFTKLGAGTVLFSSSLPEEVSLEDSRWQHGAFTRALVDILADPAANDSNADGYLCLAELSFALETRVKELTGGRQHPAIDRPGTISGDFKLLRFPPLP